MILHMNHCLKKAKQKHQDAQTQNLFMQSRACTEVGILTGYVFLT